MTLLPTTWQRLALSAPLALAAGITHGLSFAATPTSAPQGWLQILALSILALLWLHTTSARRAATLGYWFGLGWFGIGVHWIFTSLHVYGGMAWPLASVAVVLFCAYLALYPAFAGYLTLRCAPANRPTLSRVMWFACAWGISEWLRGVVLSGFPWIASAYAHVDSPLAGYAPVLGAYAMCTLAALCAGSVAFVLGGRVRRQRLAAALLLTFTAGIGWGLTSHHWTSPSGQPLAVRLVQGNVAQDIKFQPERLLDQFRLYYRLATATPADLIVLPETAFPVPIQHSPAGFFTTLSQHMQRTGSTLLTGIPIMQTRTDTQGPGPMGNEDWYNAVIALGPDTPQPVVDHQGLPSYRKHHLVPFGEYIPTGFGWFVAAMHMPLGEFSRGALAQTPLTVRDQRIGVNICYEDLFGAEIAAALRQPNAPTILLNVSNIAWFGHSIALPQHLLAARVRARETGRPMLRATNTGSTAIIDPRGVVQQQLPAVTQGTLVGTVQGYHGDTPYIRWGEWGWVVLLATLALFARLLRHE